MARRNLLDTSTVTFSELLGNGKIYRVPPYQRDDSWHEQHWEDLWLDILDLHRESEQHHYMGAVVLQTVTDRDFVIIDGQQRFATLSLLAIAALRRLTDLVESGVDPAQNQERIEILRRTFLGDKDPTSLLYSSKLFLNLNNDDFYQSYVLQLRAPPNPHRLSDSQRLLWQAYQYFLERLAEIDGLVEDGRRLSGFLTELVARRLLFIQITVEDELSAYTVFETLNARGLELTSTDLLKNYLFSLIPTRSDLGHVQLQWDRIANLVGTERFPEFLRYFVNARQPLVRSDRLFRHLKTQVRDGPEALELLHDLEIDADVYSALRDPSHERWRASREQRNLVRVLRLFNVRQVLPLLLACHHRFESADFTRVLRLSIVISFRYSVIGALNPNELEKLYNHAAVQVFEGVIRMPRQVFAALEEVYVPDDEFRAAFEFKAVNTMRRKRLVRYILYTLENEGRGDVALDFDDDPGTIEHVLPENPGDSWVHAFPVEVQEAYIHRLGNYVLLEAARNRDVAGAPYEVKRAAYAESGYRLAREMTYETWGPDQLNRRQEARAARAVHLWRADFDDA